MKQTPEQKKMIMEEQNKQDAEKQKQVVAERLLAFKEELKALLLKYDASIGGSYKGDTHGIYDECFVVSFRYVRNSNDNCKSCTDDIILNEYNIYVNASDLED